jgi:peptidoglycan biosynthesis protein MviN/MurJ (putative lipid II flippase)
MQVVWVAAILSFLSMAVGLARDVLIVQRLGFSIHADIIVIVLLVPMLLENIVGFVARDAAASAFAKVERGVLADARGFASGALILALIVALGVAASFLFASGGMLSALTPGWDQGSRDAAMNAFIMATSIVFFQTLVYFFVGYESVNSRFLVAASRPLLLGIAGVAALLLYDEETAALAYVVSQGAGLACFVVFFWVVYWRSQALSISTFLRSVREVARISSAFMIVPASILVIAFQQFPFLLERVAATALGAGVPTLLSFVYRLVTVPQSLFTASVLAVLAPILLREREMGGGTDRASGGMFMSLAFGLLSMCSFIAFAGDLPFMLGLVGISTESTGASFQGVVVAYAAGLPAFVLSGYLIKIGIIYGCASRLLLPGLAAAIIQASLIVFVSARWGAPGIAVSSSIFFVLFCVFSMVSIRSRVAFCIPVSDSLRMVAACLVAGVVMAMFPTSVSILGLVMKSATFVGVLAVAMVLVGARGFLRSTYWRSVIAGG